MTPQDFVIQPYPEIPEPGTFWLVFFIFVGAAVIVYLRKRVGE
jgi:hypothetical protein